jgi:hypothetical protein
MMKGILIIIVLLITSMEVNCQTIPQKELAQKNFEKFFFEFKSMYPADKNKYSFENYSKLDSIFAIPEDLITLSEMDKFDDAKTYFSIIGDLVEDEKLPLSTAKLIF